jgi:ATP-dependent Clp protease ATP-binding subunit ClpA
MNPTQDTHEVITMPILSQGAHMTWQLAAGEALHTRQQCIEKESVFIGICKLGTWLRAMKQRGKLLPNGKNDLRALCAEAEIVEETLRTFALSPDLLCNTVRAAVGQGTSDHPKKLVHRSKACKMYFQRAETLAASARVEEVHCMHLLGALLEQPGALLTAAVAIFGVDIKALHARAAAITSVLDARQTHAEGKEQGVSHLIYVGADLNI